MILISDVFSESKRDRGLISSREWRLQVCRPLSHERFRFYLAKWWDFAQRRQRMSRVFFCTSIRMNREFMNLSFRNVLACVIFGVWFYWKLGGGGGGNVVIRVKDFMTNGKLHGRSRVRIWNIPLFVIPANKRICSRCIDDWTENETSKERENHWDSNLEHAEATPLVTVLMNDLENLDCQSIIADRMLLLERI